MGAVLAYLHPTGKASGEGRFNQPRRSPLEDTDVLLVIEVCEGRKELEDTDILEDDIKDLSQVTGVNFNFHDDCKAHHTDKYSLTEQQLGKDRFLVLRRGQAFQMTLTCDQPYDQQQHELKLIFETGTHPLATKGTRVEIFLSAADQQHCQWGARLLEQKDMTLTLEVITPPSCIIGRWKFKIRTLKKTNMRPSNKIYNHSQPIYILFNPWCKEDQVYLHDKGLLEEYVLSDTGKIFKGNAKDIYGKPWAFAQFADPVLDCVLELLNKFPASNRGDPVKIVRKLTALVNSSDENRILIGNWSGNYEGGKKPTAWTGSQAILEEYYKTKLPVKFGQCWVFSGVLTTCCRAIGIPARSVTNFASAHDTDISASIDYHFDEDGNSLDYMNTDSVWNFHVRNDVWMARPDLKDQEYGGWQACDSTPKETSDGRYSCGPCPLLAIKKGDVTVPYDGRFIFAEVNADIVYWQLAEGKPNKKLKVGIKSVGQFISTYKPKCLGETDTLSWSRFSSRCSDPRWMDVTSDYKYTEGWEAERTAVMMANMTGTMASLYAQAAEESQDVSVKVVDRKQGNYGDDIVVEVELENLSREDRTVIGTWSLLSVYSTGVPGHEISKQRLQVKLSSGQKVTKTMELPFGEYNRKTIEGCYFKTFIVCNVMETNQAATDDDEFRLIKPDLILKMPQEIKVESSFRVQISFYNSLPIPLTQCSLEIHGPGHQKPRTIKQSSVGARQIYTCDVDMSVSKPGCSTLVASFDSMEMVDINGSCEVNVRGN